MANKSESDSLSGEGSCSNDMELKLRTKLTPNNNASASQRQKRLHQENSINRGMMNNENRNNNEGIDGDDGDYAHPHQMMTTTGIANTNDLTIEVNRATYNKYTDSPIHLRQVLALGGNQQATMNSNVSPLQNCSNTDGVDMNTMKYSTSNRNSTTKLIMSTEDGGGRVSSGMQTGQMLHSSPIITRKKLETTTTSGDNKGQQQSLLIVADESVLDPVRNNTTFLFYMNLKLSVDVCCLLLQRGKREEIVRQFTITNQYYFLVYQNRIGIN